jgi:hypothetical protein
MKRILLVGLLLLTSACAKSNFSTDESSNQSLNGTDGGGDVDLKCRDVLQTSTVPVRVVLSVDISGSNRDHIDAQGIARPGNDLGKTRRGGAINSFFNTYKARTNFAWSFLTFNFEISYSLIGGPTAPRFSNAASEMQTAISTFYGLADDDGTPYMAALQRIHQTIRNDAGYTSNAKYVVVFISDGIPDPAVGNSVLSDYIGQIRALAPGQVSFNTIYYGLPNPDATSRLQMMASAGGGAFLDASNGQVPDIADTVQIAGSNCQ